jgi:ParB family chromosome partitioning protein
MYTKDIKTAPPFEGLFPLKDKLFEKIYWDIEKNGFDGNKPIEVWMRHDSVIVIDGHARLKAAIKAKLMNVPALLNEFPDEKAAIEHAVRCKKKRRNLSEREIIRCVEALDKSEGKLTEPTAQLLNVGWGKIDKARAVIKKAPDKIKKAVKDGRMSIDSAYNRTVFLKNDFPKSPKLSADENNDIGRIISIIDKRLSKKLQRELIKRLVRNFT